MNWKGNGDGMLSFNFGKRPVITKYPYPNSDTANKHFNTKALMKMLNTEK